MGSICGLWALSLSNRTPTFFTYLIESTLSDVSVSRNCAALTTCGFKGQPYRFKPLTPLPMTAPPCHHPQTLPPPPPTATPQPPPSLLPRLTASCWISSNKFLWKKLLSMRYKATNSRKLILREVQVCD